MLILESLALFSVCLLVEPLLDTFELFLYLKLTEEFRGPFIEFELADFSEKMLPSLLPPDPAARLNKKQCRQIMRFTHNLVASIVTTSDTSQT